MAEETGIQWTDVTWNIARGCTKVDEDCKFCYMYRDSFDGKRYNPRQVIRTKTVFDLPLKLKINESKVWSGRPLIFTSSLTDVFHQDIDSYRAEVWNIIRRCPQYIFQILTKRPERILDHLPEDWGEGWDNVWLGTSVGSEKGVKRIDDLLKVKSRVRFLSVEPLHEPLRLLLYKNTIDWVIVGGESGHETGPYRYRPCELDWIQDVVNACHYNGVPVFVKQLGTYLSKKLNMSDRHGGNINEFPKSLQFREMPKLSL